MLGSSTEFRPVAIYRSLGKNSWLEIFVRKNRGKKFSGHRRKFFNAKLVLLYVTCTYLHVRTSNEV